MSPKAIILKSKSHDIFSQGVDSLVKTHAKETISSNIKKLKMVGHELKVKGVIAEEKCKIN
jgi:hypothetical protein